MLLVEIGAFWFGGVLAQHPLRRMANQQDVQLQRLGVCCHVNGASIASR